MLNSNKNYLENGYVYPLHKWIFTDGRLEEKLTNLRDCDTNIKKIDRSAFNRINLLLPLVYIVSFIRVLYYYGAQFFIANNEKSIVNSIIIHSGRGYDVDNLYNLFSINHSDSYKIHAYNINDFMGYEKVNFLDLMKNFIESINEYRFIFSTNLSDDILLIIIETGSANISIYTYLKTFFQKIKHKNQKCVVYSGALLPSHAAISSKLETINVYHGLMRKINLNAYPNYNSIYVYSNDEKKYFCDMKLNSLIHVIPTEKIESHSKTVIFFMPDSKYRVNPEDFSNLVKIFKLNNYKIFMKMHPLDSAPQVLVREYGIKKIEWNNILDLTGIVKLDGENATNNIRIKYPSFVVGWGSTALCESLNSDVIPIIMNDIYRDYSTIIYPLRSRSLVWPNEKHIVKGLLSESNASVYKDTISMLKNR